MYYTPDSHGDTVSEYEDDEDEVSPERKAFFATLEKQLGVRKAMDGDVETNFAAFCQWPGGSKAGSNDG